MEAAPAIGPGRGATRAKMLREPLLWAATSAFAGTALGVFGVLWKAGQDHPFYVDPTQILVADSTQFAGGALAASSSLGVVYLLWRVLRGWERRVVSLGTALLASLLAAYAVGVVSAVYWNTGYRLRGYVEFPFPGLEAAAFDAIAFLPPVALFFFAAGSLASGEKRLGAVLACLCLLTVPYGVLQVFLFPPDPGVYTDPRPLVDAALMLLGWYPTGVGLIEAPFWVLLGAMLLRRARTRISGGAPRTREKENLRAARTLYERGLGEGDASVVDYLVSDDFRDLRRGSRGKLAMERVFSALWKSYPDLAVSIERQEAEGDLVRTRLVLSGTDTGGVLWYPATGKKVRFTADFEDRFLDGELIEHEGEADTEDLLEQLGLDTAR